MVIEEGKKRTSGRKKKVLTVLGIVFGTVLIFAASFILSFNFIINPIVTPIGDAELEKENDKLKSEVQSLKDENELLNTTVEKYRNSSSGSSAGGASSGSGYSSGSNAQSSSNSGSSSKTSGSKKEQSSSGSSSQTSGSKHSESTNGSSGEQAGSKNDSKNTQGSQSGEQPAKTEGEGKTQTENTPTFSPETTTTPEGGAAEEVEPDITVIDVSE